MSQKFAMSFSALILVALPSLAAAQTASAVRPDRDRYSALEERVYGGPSHRLTPLDPRNEGLDRGLSGPLALARSRAASARFVNVPESLELSEDYLETGHYRRALGNLADVQAYVLSRGDAADRRVVAQAGRAALLRALAEQGLGKQQEALWDLHVAAAVDPALRGGDLAEYGRVGRALAAARDAEAAAIAAALQTSGVEAPAPRRLGAGRERALGVPPIEQRMNVRSVVDHEGRLRRPQVFGDADPLVTLAVLDALRSERFERPRAGQRPAMVELDLAVDLRAADRR